MNNFDRPKGITIDPRGSGGLEVAGAEPEGAPDYKTEYTSWTSLTDLGTGRFLVRTYGGLNYIALDFAALADTTQVKLMPLDAAGRLPAADVTAQFLGC